MGIGASSSTNWWGIKEVVVILKLCNSQCSACNDYTASNCTACTDSRRVTNQTSYPNQCLCHGTTTNVGLFYQEPTASTCVLLCPALPTETFGDNLTRNCVTKCPNNSYAYTDLYRCWANCPKTSVVSGALLFQDKDNWRCVPNCPSTSPYGNEDDGTCYLNCPNTTNSASTTNYYAVDGNNPRCVSTCPYNSSYWLFGYQGKCIPRCPSGSWGDPATKLCLANCNNATAAPYPFKDSSSGINVCVANCPYSNYFRDNSTFTCVLACPSPKFGETNRECVPRCADGSFGLPFGNRKCVAFCPDGYWGEPDANVCVDTPARKFCPIQSAGPPPTSATPTTTPAPASSPLPAPWATSPTTPPSPASPPVPARPRPRSSPAPPSATPLPASARPSAPRPTSPTTWPDCA